MNIKAEFINLFKKLRPQKYTKMESINIRKPWMIYVAWVNVVMQILLPISFVFTNIANAAPNQSNQTTSAYQQNQNIEDFAKGQFKNHLTQEVETYLTQWGTTEARVNVNDDGDLAGSNIDMLLPIDEDEDGLFFTQLGARYSNVDYRKVTANFGLGYRDYEEDKYTTGYNAFLDHQFQNSHTRLGLGLEHHRDNLKMNLNGYIGLSQWKNSDYLANYEEKPAHGFDARLEGYLPDHPQLGGKLEYEHYFGDEVALFNLNGRSKNPHAFTLGLNYTPVPLLTFGIDHRTGSNSQNDTQFFLSLNYAMGVDFDKQLEHDNVIGMRSVIGQRHSLVQRNNEIVLKYRKTQHIHVSTVPRITGEQMKASGEINQYKLDLRSDSTFNVVKYEWNLNRFAQNGGIVHLGQTGDAYVTLPAYIPGGNNIYTIEVFAIDEKGNRSNVSSTIIEVVQNGPILQSVVDTPKPADGTTPNIVDIEIIDKDGLPIPNTNVVVKIPDNYPNACFVAILPGATCQPQDTVREYPTGPDGHLPPLEVFSNEPGGVPLIVEVPQYPSLPKPQIVVPFTPMPGVITNLLTKIDVLVNNALADGLNSNKVIITTLDGTVNLPYTEVEITTPNAGVKFIDPMTKNPVDTVRVFTNGNGEVELELTRIFTGDVTLNVVAIESDSPVLNSKSSTVVTFIPNAALPKITIIPENPTIADGNTPNDVIVKVTNPDGKPLPDTKIELTLDPNNPNICFKPITVGTPCQPEDKIIEVTTGPDGTVPDVPVYSTEGGDFPIIGKIPGTNPPYTEEILKFTPVPKLEIITLTPDGVIANGTTPNEVEITLTDISGTGIANEKVTISLDPTDPQVCFNEVLATPNTNCQKTIEVTTEPDGKVKIPVYSTKTGTPTVTANYTDPANPSNVLTPSTNVKFVPDANSATITLTPTDKPIANGLNPNPVEITVLDPKGNNLPEGSIIELTLDPASNACFVPILVGTSCADANKTLNVTVKADGTVDTVDVYSMTSGAPLISAQLQNTTSPKISTGVPFIDRFVIVADQVLVDNQIADGNNRDKVQFKVLDQNGAPASAGQTVTISVPAEVRIWDPITNNWITTGSLDVFTDANGLVIVELASIVEGTNYPINAALKPGDILNTTDQTAQLSVKFKNIANLTLVQPLSPADQAYAIPTQYTGDKSVGNIPLTGNVSDQLATPLAGVTVTLTVNDSNVSLCQSNGSDCKKGGSIEVITDADGNYNFITNSITIGTPTITAKVLDPVTGEKIISAPTAVVKFVNDPTSSKIVDVMRISDESRTALADQTTDRQTNLYKITVTDKFGNPVAGQDIRSDLPSTALDIRYGEITPQMLINPNNITFTQTTNIAKTGAEGLAYFAYFSSRVQKDIQPDFTLVSTGAQVTGEKVKMKFIENPVGVVLSAGPPTASKNSGKPLPYGGKIPTVTPVAESYYTVVFTLKDGYGFPIPDRRLNAPFTGLNVSVNGLDKNILWEGDKYITDQNGQVTITVQGEPGKFELSGVTATLFNGSESNAVTVTGLDFIPNFSGGEIVAESSKFALTAGFPTTGYQGAKFTFVWPASQVINLSDYDWSIDNAVIDRGSVLLNQDPMQTPVTLTLVHKSFANDEVALKQAATFTYTFTLQHWFVKLANNQLNHAGIQDLCTSLNPTSSLPAANLLTTGTGNREVGALFNEWGVGAFQSGSQYHTSVEGKIIIDNANHTGVVSDVANGTPARGICLVR